MTTAIIYSRDRACQLDLLLHSIEENAAGLYSRVQVIWKGSDAPDIGAYRLCAQEHEWAEFDRETDLRTQTLDGLGRGGCAAFLMDDCVYYRPSNGLNPAAILADDDDVLCFSPRLGLNTSYCYPLRSKQARPLASAEDGILYWDWEAAEGDFSYPMSLDGHVFRTDDLRALLFNVLDWRTPNTVEASLAGMAGNVNRSVMAAAEASTLVGVPANRVGETHAGNRFGEEHPYLPADLNRCYLDGKRLSLSSVDPDSVNAAHVEFPLRFA